MDAEMKEVISIDSARTYARVNASNWRMYLAMLEHALVQTLAVR